jgi:O-antigen biosynthesis protein
MPESDQNPPTDERDRQLTDARRTIADLRRQLSRMSRQLEETRDTLATIYASKSWRALTAYRQVKQAFVKLGRRASRLVRKTAKATFFLLTDRAEFKLRWQRWLGTRGSPDDPRPELQAVWCMQGRPYAKWLAKYHPPIAPEAARRRIEAMTMRPKLSIVMPAYNTAEEDLRAAIESVRGQLYDDWELCIADDASAKQRVREVLNEYAAKDDRIRVRSLEKNLGIAGASNAALSMATGDFIGLLDHDDLLHPEALLEAAALLNEHPDTDMIYTDEDKIDLDGRRRDPFFKPDWSPTTFLSYMYTCHLGVYRKSLVDRLGGFRQGVDGSQDYDLVLRLTEQTPRIRHIPKVLYHWRMTPQSTALSSSNKNYTEQAAVRALADAMQRRGVAVREVEIGRVPTTYRIRYPLRDAPAIHMIVPSKNNARYLQRCVRSILERTEYQHYRIHVVDNGSVDEATLSYLEQLESEPRVRVLHYDYPFNYSAINNWAVSQTDGEYLLLLNDDTEVISPGWLEAMLEQAQRPEVGAVGAKLLYPDGRIQHGGVILGIGGVAAHAHKYYSASHAGYFSRLEVVQNFSAVTAACMMTRREVYDKVGGFNETDLAVAFNDVDFCLRVREAGYEIIYTPFAELYHHESVSRGLRLSGDEIGYMQRTWGRRLFQDPFYNPNLTMRREDFSLCP